MILPKITIMTCTYNSEKYLEDCIESVKKQSYKNIEHLFIDGLSTDKTLDIIKKYYNKPNLISKKAQGVYDAFNQGFKNATGNIIGFLHSDDVYYDKNCLERVANAFIKKPQIKYYCARMLVCDEKLDNYFAILGAAPHKPTMREQLYSSTYYAHPTYYIKKEVIKQVGYFNMQYKIAADIDWLMRLEKLNLPYYFDDKFLVKLRAAGVSARHYFIAIFEEFKVNKKHNGLSLKLIIIYLFHLLRRSIRFILEKLKLNKVISLARKFNLKIL